MVCGAKMNAVVIGAFNNAAADTVDMLRGLVKRDLVHKKFLSQINTDRIICKNPKIITESMNVGFCYR